MKRDEFDKSMVQLMNLLKKIMKHYPKGAQLPNFLDPKEMDKVNLNICFFNFIPMSPEDMEEFEEAYAELLEQSDESEAETLELEWNDSDLDFLKRHGMTF